MASLLTAPADELNRELIEAFLAQQLPESINLEYKAQPTRHLLTSIAAMANTVGGVILVGVDETRGLPARTAAGVALGEQEVLVNRCWTSFDPPFVPEIHPIPVDSDRYVLVVRIDASRVSRPVFLEGRVPVRLPGRVATATRAQVAALFNEESAQTAYPVAVWGGNYGPRRSHPMLTQEQVGLAMRVAVSARATPAGASLLGGAVHRHLEELLNGSQLERWILSSSDIIERRSPSGWHRRGFNRSSTVTYERNQVKTLDDDYFLRGQCVVEAPYGPARGGVVTLMLGVALEPDAGVERAALLFEDLYALVHVLYATALDEIARELFPPLIGSQLWEPAGMFFELDPGNQSSIQQFIQIRGRPVSGAQALMGATLDVPPGSDLREYDERDAAIRHWFVRMLLDGGYGDAEERVAGLQRPAV